MSVSGTGNNHTFNVQGNQQQQGTGSLSKLKKRALATTSIAVGAGAFVGAVAIGTNGYQENGTQAERLGAAALAATGLTGIVAGAASFGRDALGYSGQPQQQNPQGSNNV